MYIFYCNDFDNIFVNLKSTIIKFTSPSNSIMRGYNIINKMKLTNLLI